MKSRKLIAVFVASIAVLVCVCTVHLVRMRRSRPVDIREHLVPPDGPSDLMTEVSKKERNAETGNPLGDIDIEKV